MNNLAVRVISFTRTLSKLPARVGPSNLIVSRSIMTSKAKLAEQAMEGLKANPYFEKYATKIAALQETSPEEFLSRLEEQSKTRTSPKLKEHECSTSASKVAKVDLTTSHMQDKPKLLSDVMKVNLLHDKSAKEIEEIWHKYYENKDGLAACIPAEVYLEMHERGLQYPLFLLPLPRSNGYEFFVCQFAGHSIHFTQLINFQTHKENAPECLALHHYKDLINDKKIVLMRGEFDTNVLDAKEAQCLVNQLQLYYSKPDEKKVRLLDRFTHAPGEFKHMDLVAELECLSL